MMLQCILLRCFWPVTWNQRTSDAYLSDCVYSSRLSITIPWNKILGDFSGFGQEGLLYLLVKIWTYSYLYKVFPNTDFVTSEGWPPLQVTQELERLRNESVLLTNFYDTFQLRTYFGQLIYIILLYSQSKQHFLGKRH